jgi:hypothetical protein
MRGIQDAVKVDDGDIQLISREVERVAESNQGVVLG